MLGNISLAACAKLPAPLLFSCSPEVGSLEVNQRHPPRRKRLAPYLLCLVLVLVLDARKPGAAPLQSSALRGLFDLSPVSGFGPRQNPTEHLLSLLELLAPPPPDRWEPEEVIHSQAPTLPAKLHCFCQVLQGFSDTTPHEPRFPQDHEPSDLGVDPKYHHENSGSPTR